MKILVKKFFLTKNKLSYLQCFYIFKHNKLAILAEIVNQTSKITLPNIHYGSINNDFIKLLKIEKSNFSRVTIHGINQEKIFLKNNTFQILKNKKIHIQRYLAFLQKNFKKIAKVMKVFLNLLIHLHSFNLSSKQIFLEKLIFQNCAKVILLSPEIINLIENLISNFQMFEKIVEKKMLCFSPYKYI